MGDGVEGLQPFQGAPEGAFEEAERLGDLSAEEEMFRAELLQKGVQGFAEDGAEVRIDLQGGFFDIMEPVGEPFERYEDIDLAVVPGMAFDSQNNRLGRGKGYYDRMLPRLTKAYKIGVCFDFQRLPGIPADEHDCKVDEVI